MASVLERDVAAFAARHDLLPAGMPVLALVSGGADSMCLLHMLARLHGGPLGVVTFDHGLRDEAAQEAAAVMRAADRLGLPAWTRRLALARGPGVQERARDARRAEALALARDEGYARIATGHTLSDHVETILFRLARGTGRTGALGMAPREGSWIRILRGVTRERTRAWCAEHGVAFTDDPANLDPTYRRVRVRHGVVPALEDVHPAAQHAVARFADLLGDEAELLRALEDDAWGRCRAAGGLSARALGREHPALARLLVRRLLDGAGLAGDSEWVARAVALARDGGRPVQMPGGVLAVDRGVLVAETAALGPPVAAVLTVPGRVAFGERLVRAEWTARDAPLPTATRVGVSLTGPFTVRGPKSGDRLPLAGGGSQPVGRLLAAAGVPARHRAGVPVVESGGRVVWVAGYRAHPDLLARPDGPATILEVTGA